MKRVGRVETELPIVPEIIVTSAVGPKLELVN